MKKLVSVLLTFVLVLSTLSLTAFAVSDSVNVYVSISSSKDTLNMAYVSVEVTDIDGDGSLTINDALYCAHEKSYKGGAAEGYASYKHPLYAGLSLSKLWGVENGGSYGYFVNDKSSYSLLDKVGENDHVYAFAYSDTDYFSDEYAFFTKKTVSTKTGTEVTLTLKKLSYNAFWILEESPVEGAAITVDGKKTGIVTDENGCATVILTRRGEHTVSALSPEGSVITPPVCVANVSLDLFALISYYIQYIVAAVLSIMGK